MKRFVEVGGPQARAFCCPFEFLDDYVGEDNPVRADRCPSLTNSTWKRLGFSGVVAGGDTGRPAYHPATLLKIYLYGYLNRIQSSRRLEREDPTQHRAHVADRPTDAGLQDDRRLPPRQRAGDPRGLRAVRRAVPSVQPFHADYRCDRREQVQGGQQSRQRTFTVAKVAKRIEAGGGQHRALPGGLGPCRSGRTAIWPRQRQSAFKEKIECLQRQMQSYSGRLASRLRPRPTNRSLLTDPDARSMATSGKGALALLWLQCADRRRCRAPSDRRP